MNTVVVSIVVPVVLCFGALASTVAILYNKLRIAIGNLFITDENGKIKKFKVFEFVKIVLDAVTTAEETGKKGAEKKEIALATIQATLDSLGADYDITELSGTIDTLVGLLNAFIKKNKKK